MGNLQVKKFFRSSEHDDIISEKSLQAVKDVIFFLKQHSREEGLFRRSGHILLRNRILNSLKKGEKLQILNNIDAARECAAALHLYLSQMKVPVLPKRVQNLLLAENPGISAHMVARDALGLIRQDVMGRHSELLVSILELLRHLLIFPPPTEHTELRAPLLSDNVIKWCQVASRLNELIIEVPKELLQKNIENGSSDLKNISNGGNSLGRFRDLSLFYPFIRLVESNTYRIRRTQRNANRPLQRPRVGRLHPIMLRLRT